MSISVSLHPQSFSADRTEISAWVQIGCGHGSYAALHVSAAQCDELIAAATDAKRLATDVEAGGQS
jgi:hypothetical protein